MTTGDSQSLQTTNTVCPIKSQLIHDYIRHIATFARFLGRSPNTASGDDIRRFQLAQVEQGAQPPKMNTQASALRFFFTITLGRADRPSTGPHTLSAEAAAGACSGAGRPAD